MSIVVLHQHANGDVTLATWVVWVWVVSNALVLLAVLVGGRS